MIQRTVVCSFIMHLFMIMSKRWETCEASTLRLVVWNFADSFWEISKFHKFCFIDLAFILGNPLSSYWIFLNNNLYQLLFLDSFYVFIFDLKEKSPFAYSVYLKVLSACHLGLHLFLKQYYSCISKFFLCAIISFLNFSNLDLYY